MKPNPDEKSLQNPLLTSQVFTVLVDILFQFYRIRNVVYGLVFLVYLWFIHPRLIGILIITRTTGQTYVLLGFVIVLAQAVEPIGVWLKRPAVRERICCWPFLNAF